MRAIDFTECVEAPCPTNQKYRKRTLDNGFRICARNLCEAGKKSGVKRINFCKISVSKKEIDAGELSERSFRQIKRF